jgi:hypothetical protein
MNVDWLLPFTRPKRFEAGDILMERGEYATAAFYIVSGEVEILEAGECLGNGTMLPCSAKSACSLPMARAP